VSAFLTALFWHTGAGFFGEGDERIQPAISKPIFINAAPPAAAPGLKKAASVGEPLGGSLPSNPWATAGAEAGGLGDAMSGAKTLLPWMDSIWGAPTARPLQVTNTVYTPLSGVPQFPISRSANSDSPLERHDLFWETHSCVADFALRLKAIFRLMVLRYYTCTLYNPCLCQDVISNQGHHLQQKLLQGTIPAPAQLMNTL